MEDIRQELNAKSASESKAPREGVDQAKEPSPDHPQTPPGIKNDQLAAEQKPSPSPDKPAEDTVKHADYGASMSKQTFDLLKRVPIGLVDPAQWKAMDAVEQTEHVQLVKELINRQKREYNASRQTQGKQPAGDDVTDLPQQPGPSQSRGAVEGSGVSAQPAALPGEQLPADKQALLDRLAETYGADDPLVVLQRTSMLENQRLQRALDARESNEQKQAKAQHTARQIRAFEDSVFEGLQEKYPMLADDKTRDKVREHCLSYDAIRAEKHGPFDSVEDRTKFARESIAFVVHKTLYPEIQKQRQTQSKQNQDRSLSQSLDRGPVTTPAKPFKAGPVDPVAAMTDIAERLSTAAAQGLNGERRRQAVLPGSR